MPKFSPDKEGRRGVGIRNLPLNSKHTHHRLMIFHRYQVKNTEKKGANS